MTKSFVIVVAAGVGSRMNSDIPKQFMVLNERPILMHTLSRFAESRVSLEIILVLSLEMFGFWEELCQQYAFDVAVHRVAGGATRYDSVKNGLTYIQQRWGSVYDPSVAIGVHDGARPLVSEALIARLYDAAATGRCVVPAVQSTDSIRLGEMEQSVPFDRAKVWLVQTPQVFPAEVIIRAYEQEASEFFTDDASVVEKNGNPITLLLGDSYNLKITRPQDIEIAKRMLLDHG